MVLFDDLIRRFGFMIGSDCWIRVLRPTPLTSWDLPIFEKIWEPLPTTKCDCCMVFTLALPRRWRCHQGSTSQKGRGPVVCSLPQSTHGCWSWWYFSQVKSIVFVWMICLQDMMRWFHRMCCSKDFIKLLDQTTFYQMIWVDDLAKMVSCAILFGWFWLNAGIW